MNTTLDLTLEKLDEIEAPLSDTAWGVIAGVAFAAGVVVGALVVT